MDINRVAEKAKRASLELAAVPVEVKNRALAAISDAIQAEAGKIITANQDDCKRAEQEQLAMPLLKRLYFEDKKIKEACLGIKSLINLPDPVGTTLSATELDNDLELFKVSCPIGVIGVVFESRPDALVQISALCLKSGNAALLKGGSEASSTNRILADIIHDAAMKAGIPSSWMVLLETRDDVADMLSLDDHIDLVIPRGSNDFVRYIMDNTRIPVLGHADGICHVYVDKVADMNMAERICVDSKTQYVAVCNAAETILVHRDIAEIFLPKLKTAFALKDVEIRGCKETARIVDAQAATEEDWKTEYLDLIVSVKVVDDLNSAIDHINRYGSGHTDAIVTSDNDRARRFLDYVDSADIFVNCSTRFSDGFRYGLGAEVGISTDKIHARGPVGLEGLTIYKWRLIGKGHIVADYSGEGSRKFIHRKLDKRFGDIV